MSATQPGKRVADIQADRLVALNAGTVQAATLTECLAVDFALLMENTLPHMAAGAVTSMRHAAADGISRRMMLAGKMIHEVEGLGTLDMLRTHQSDTVRGWACFVVGADRALDLEARLALIQPLADDGHFGTREWAWMAMRPHIAADLDNALAQLALWTSAPSERIRRFASEATRPRGVWCAHIEALKQSPEMALPILAPLKADASGYVQDSVGNWLNDASKTNASWVRNITELWMRESMSPATARICKRGMRSLTRSKQQS